MIATVAIATVASMAVGAGPRRWQPPACSDRAGALKTATRSAAPTDPSALRNEAWFRLDPQLDRRGALQGQRLALGIHGERWSRVVDLPPESFAAGPFGRIVLVGTDDGASSRLEAVDVAGACAWPIALELDVIRRATIDPSGETAYEMRVDRVTRADLGIWARPLDGRPAVQVLGPIEPDDRFGRTFSTEFSWDLAGATLAVSSCGEAACRTRIVEPSTGRYRTVGEPDLGTVVGLAGDVLVSYAACAGLPCPIVATDIATGVRTTLVEAGSSALAIDTPDGPRLVHEAVTDTGIELRSTALDGTTMVVLGTLDDGLRLQPAADVAAAGMRVPTGWVVLGPDGRLPETGPDATTQIRRIADGATVLLDEVSK